MNSRRISLTRILAIHWYGFRQILDVTNDTLISGTFGTGKSALLDLMQYVMLGEHWRPNRAASGNARGRTLVGYCLCDTNTMRQGEVHFTRPSGVTIVGMEFTWPTDPKSAQKGGEPRRETWGVRIEYASPTSEPKRTYFLIPERVTWAQLAPEGQLLDEETFRAWIRREFGREFLFPRQQDYLAEMATPHHLYFDQEQFHKTFPKAIAFEPEENVEKFIREFILEDQPLEVRDVKAAVRAYRDTLARLEKQVDEAGLLRRVATFHEAYEKARRQHALYQHIGFQVEESRLRELVQRHESELKSLDTRHADNNAAFESTTRERESLDRQLQECALDADDQQLEKALEQKRQAASELQGLKEAQLAVRERLKRQAHRWVQWIDQGEALTLSGLKQELERVDDEALAGLRSENEAEGLAALPKLARLFNEIFRNCEGLLSPLARQSESDSSRLRQLGEDIERLERNETPGTFPVYQAIRSRFQHSSPPPEQLCRVVEVKGPEEEWRQALELALGHHRWAILIAPQDYREALDLLRKTSPGRESESLIHPREVMELSVEIRKGSVYDKLETQHPTAAHYLQHHLGQMMPANRPEDLDAHARGITRDGFLKEHATRRRLKPVPGLEFSLGTEGIKRLRDAALREQKELATARDARQALIESVRRWLDHGKHVGLEDAALPDRSSELSRIPHLEANLKEVETRIGFLSTPERKNRIQQRIDLQNKRDNALIKLGELMRSRADYQQRRLELSDALQGATVELEQAHLTTLEDRRHLPAGILDAEIQRMLQELLNETSKWGERSALAIKRAEESNLASVQALNARQSARQDLIQHPQHPEYRHDFPADEPGNETWSMRLRLLEETELPKFRTLAAERRKDWEKRLQESVLDRLNERLKDAERTIRQLRQYLDRDIGRYRYRISQKRDSTCGALWKLLDSGFEPTDELLAATRTDDVQEALQQLMEAVEGAEHADERAQRLLDYRYYHHYDLEMVLANRPDAPPISLGRSGRNLSGGENQAPFFISMLAAFHRVYDLGSTRSQHLGLVVMDEAFSKLSGDGVEDCLELARNFELQLVLAFPPEKLGIMAPFADTVIMCRKQEERDSSGYVTRIDNIPVMLTPQQVRDAL